MGIQITNNDYNSLKVLLENFTHGHPEFEAALTPRNITKEGFYRCLSIISNSEQGQRDADVEVLDINITNPKYLKRTKQVFQNPTVRVSISSRAAISSYCSNDLIPLNSKMMYKQKIGHYDLESYGIRFRLSSEEQLDHNERKQIFSSGIKEDLKSFRLKKRVSVTVTNFRFDFTIVKQNSLKDFRKFPSSFATLPESYEIEIEYIGNFKNTTHKSIIFGMFENLSKAIKALDNNMFILSFPSIRKVIKEYVQLVESQCPRLKKSRQESK